MNDATHAQNGPAKRRTGIPRDLPDQETAADAVEEDAGGDEELPDTDEAGSGPRRPGIASSASGESGGDREPPGPVEPTD